MGNKLKSVANCLPQYYIAFTIDKKDWIQRLLWMRLVKVLRQNARVSIVWLTVCSRLRKNIKTCAINTERGLVNLISLLPIVTGNGNSHRLLIASLGSRINLAMLDPTAWMVLLWLCILYGIRTILNRWL
jgi:hypothetical protein